MAVYLPPEHSCESTLFLGEVKRLLHTRRKPVPHRVFRNAARFYEMQQVVGPARLRAGPGKPETAERLTAH